MNFVPPNLTVSDQTVPMPTRDRLMGLIEKIGIKLEDMTEEMIAEQPAEAFNKVLTTLSHVGSMWLGQHDSDVKELMESLSDADIQVSLKKEIEAAHAKGQAILP
jgi:hypothetical protein